MQSLITPCATTQHYRVTSVDQADGSNARSICFDALNSGHAIELSKPSGIGNARYLVCERLPKTECSCARTAVTEAALSSAQPRRWRRWLTAHGHDLGACTIQDASVLEAVAACWTLYAAAGDKAGRLAALYCVRHLLCAMQPESRPLAKALIAYALNPDHRDRLWDRMLSIANPFEGDEAAT